MRRYNEIIDRLFAHSVLVADGVMRDPVCRRRFEAMMARIDAAKVEQLTDGELERRLHAIGVREELPRGGLDGREAGKRVIAFGLLPEEEVFPGYSWRELRSGKRERLNGVLCHTAVEVQSVVGCAFDCTYCPYTSFLCVRLDVERFADRVAELAMSRRGQALYKLNNRSDTLGLEPEYGLATAMVERFARLEGKYLMLYSKGDTVAHLADLDHRGRTVASFTLTPAPVAALLEVGAPPPHRRVAAIGELARAGYPIRVRFSPIVPLRGWRDAYRDLIAQLAAVAKPELVTLWALSMIPIAELDRIVPIAELDEAALAAARAAADEMDDRKGAPFPPAYRAAVYAELSELLREALPATAVSLCLESAEVWDRAAGGLVPRAAGEFVCNCGPKVTPDALVPLRTRATR